MKIQFKKDYSGNPDTRWGEVVSDFLVYLSGVYGYTIDEYDMGKMVNNRKMARLAPLVEAGNPAAIRMFQDLYRIDTEEFLKAARARQADLDVRNALYPPQPATAKVKK